MKAFLSKGHAKATLTFEYSTEFGTLTAAFRTQHFYLNTKNQITRSQAKAVIRKILMQLKSRNITVSGIRLSSLPTRKVNYTLVSPTGSLVENITNYLTLTNLRVEVFR